MPPGAHALYFALRPPAEVAPRLDHLLARATTRHGLGGWPVAPARRHVSLTGLGAFHAVPAQVIERACRAARAVRAPAFRIAFNRLGTWGRGDGPRPIVLHGDDGVIGAEALHCAIHAALAGPGICRGAASPIWPHMTLSRDRVDLPEQVVAPVGWWVREFVLVDSVFGQARHDLLGRFPLTD